MHVSRRTPRATGGRVGALTLALLIALPATAAAQEASPSASPSPSPLVASPSPSPSPSPRTKEQRVHDARRKLRAEQERNPKLLSLLKEGDALRAAIDRALREINAQIASATERLAEAEREAKIAADDLRRARIALKRARQELATQKAILAKHVAHLYMVGPNALADLVMSADSMNEAMTKEMYGRAALQSDAIAVERFLAALEKVRAHERDVRARKEAVDTLVSATRTELRSLEELRSRQHQIRLQMFDDMGLRAEALAKLLNASNPYAAVLASYSSATAGFTDLIREAQREQRPARFRRDWLQRPVAGPVSSAYGWRVHPVYGYASFHTGVDFAQDAGVPVRTARAGRVIDAGYFGAYGLTVLVDHGDSVATIYAHLSKLAVAPDEVIKDGAVIGRIGSTGWSTGPHLHFEVRMNGKPDEPLKWL